MEQIRLNAKREKNYAMISWRGIALSVDDFRVALLSGLVFPIPDEAAHREKSDRAFTFLPLVKS